MSVKELVKRAHALIEEFNPAPTKTIVFVNRFRDNTPICDDDSHIYVVLETPPDERTN
jgi:hypothetical protein